MLSLTSPRWSELQHAYGDASDIPNLLAQLVDLPLSHNYEDEPWFSLWSALAHQGNVYSASFAAVPYVIQAITLSPLTVDFTYFQFPTWIEICRIKNDVPIPNDIAPSYFEALAQIPVLAATVLTREHCDTTFLTCVLSALALVKGQHVIAEILTEMSPDIAEECLLWIHTR